LFVKESLLKSFIKKGGVKSLLLKDKKDVYVKNDHMG